jgi:hypothetical protein
VFLVRVAGFEPAPQLDDAALRRELVTGVRWWTPAEIAVEGVARFAPRDLHALLADLLRAGPPAEPVRVGF